MDERPQPRWWERRVSIRWLDVAQLYCVGFGLFFLITIVASNVFAQSQDAINATVFERLNSIIARQDRLENYMNASIIALIANFVAHLVQIHGQKAARKRDVPRDWSE